MTAEPFSSLFDEEPHRWGLRGDPHLWREMKRVFAGRPLPETEAALVAAVETAFRLSVGVPMTHPEIVFVKRFSHGGMSSGCVSPAFWREEALPLLAARYRELYESANRRLY